MDSVINCSYSAIKILFDVYIKHSVRSLTLRTSVHALCVRCMCDTMSVEELLNNYSGHCVALFKIPEMAKWCLYYGGLVILSIGVATFNTGTTLILIVERATAECSQSTSSNKSD